jgi:hypothetical protein
MKLENIFLNRLKEREPTLFVTEDDANKLVKDFIIFIYIYIIRIGNNQIIFYILE